MTTKVCYKKLYEDAQKEIAELKKQLKKKNVKMRMMKKMIESAIGSDSDDEVVEEEVDEEPNPMDSDVEEEVEEEEYTDAQKWFLFNTDRDGTLLCDLFRAKFGDEMSVEKNKRLNREVELNKMVSLKPNGWFSNRTTNPMDSDVEDEEEEVIQPKKKWIQLEGKLKSQFDDNEIDRIVGLM